MRIADNIKRIRKERGLSQVELADRSGLSRGSIQGYESGKFSPKPEAAFLIAKALECSLIDIYGILDNDALNAALSALQQTEDEINAIEADIDERGYPRIAGLGVLIDHFRKLNTAGQDKVIDYAADLATMPKYQASAPDPADQ